ncbi:hypothetical protein MMC19_002530 [Ptychographa xylographoides]|nr:hypothetical protein [Ptychographa xylographoides]
MDQSETVSDPHQGAAFRRGKQLAPIRTSFEPKTPRVQRPRPIETIIYEKPSDPNTVDPDLPHILRRTSKGGLRALFSRSKATKNAKEEEQLRSTVEEGDVVPNPIARVATPSVKSARTTQTSLSREVPTASAPPLPPTSTQSSQETTNHAAPLTSRPERPVQSLKSWNPPPLFQAYPQSVKHSNLPAPTSSVEAILKMDRNRRMNGTTEVFDQDGTSVDQAVPGIENESRGEPGAKKMKPRKSTAMHLGWTSKVYVLATSGLLLQYAGDGNFDRIPEKVLQLGKDSAAFASDVIPGRLYVLQILQASNEDGATTTSKSVFSRFAFRSELRRSVPSFLLVLDSPEEMNSWLVAVRKEIEALGGKCYRPDVGVRRNTDEVVQQLREKPSRRYLIKRDPNQFSTPRTLQPIVDNVHTPDQEPCNPRAASRVETSSHPNRMSLVPRESVDAPSTTFTSLSADQVLLDRLRESTRSSFASTGDQTSVASYGPSTVPSPSKSRFMDEVDPNYYGESLVPVANDDDVRRRSFQVQPTRVKERRPSLDLKPVTSFSRPLSTTSSSTIRTVSPVTPNFSVPTFSKRYSQCGTSKQLPTPPASAGTTHRSPSPDSRVQSSERPESIVGELPSLHVSPKASRSRTNLNTEVSSASFVAAPSGINQPSTVLSPVVTQNDRPVPRRFSSLEYSTGKLPFATPHQNLSPHPPPTSALPALPPPDTSQFKSSQRPSSARSATPHKLRRPASMQVRSEPLPPLRASSSLARMHMNTASSPQQFRKSLHALPIHAPPMTSPPRQPLPSVPLVTIEASTPEMTGKGWAEQGGVEVGYRGVRVS